MKQWREFSIYICLLLSCTSCRRAESDVQLLEAVRAEWNDFEIASKCVSGTVLLSTADNTVSSETYVGNNDGAGLIWADRDTTSATAVFGNEEYLATARCENWATDLSYRQAAERTWELETVKLRDEVSDSKADLLRSPNLALIGSSYQLSEAIFGGSYKVDLRHLSDDEILVTASAMGDFANSMKIQYFEAVLIKSQHYVLKSLKYKTPEGLHENDYKFRSDSPIPLLQYISFTGPNGEIHEMRAELQMNTEIDKKLFALSHFGLSGPVETK